MLSSLEPVAMELGESASRGWPQGEVGRPLEDTSPLTEHSRALEDSDSVHTGANKNPTHRPIARRIRRSCL